MTTKPSSICNTAEAFRLVSSGVAHIRQSMNHVSIKRLPYGSDFTQWTLHEVKESQNATFEQFPYNVPLLINQEEEFGQAYFSNRLQMGTMPCVCVLYNKQCLGQVLVRMPEAEPLRHVLSNITTRKAV